MFLFFIKWLVMLPYVILCLFVCFGWLVGLGCCCKKRLMLSWHMFIICLKWLGFGVGFWYLLPLPNPPTTTYWIHFGVTRGVCETTIYIYIYDFFSLFRILYILERNKIVLLLLLLLFKIHFIHLQDMHGQNTKFGDSLVFHISSSIGPKPDNIRKRRISATNNVIWAQDDFNFMTIVLMD